MSKKFDLQTIFDIKGIHIAKPMRENNKILRPFFNPKYTKPGFVWKNPLRFYPAGLIRINPPGKSLKNPPESGFF